MSCANVSNVDPDNMVPRPPVLLLSADPHEPDKMTVDGIMRFLEDLGLSPESKLVLIIAWKFKAVTQCEFTREEFMTGMSELG